MDDEWQELPINLYYTGMEELIRIYPEHREGLEDPKLLSQLAFDLLLDKQDSFQSLVESAKKEGTINNFRAEYRFITAFSLAVCKGRADLVRKGLERFHLWTPRLSNRREELAWYPEPTKKVNQSRDQWIIDHSIVDAAKLGHVEIVELLLEAGSNVPLERLTIIGIERRQVAILRKFTLDLLPQEEILNSFRRIAQPPANYCREVMEYMLEVNRYDICYVPAAAAIKDVETDFVRRMIGLARKEDLTQEVLRRAFSNALANGNMKVMRLIRRRGLTKFNGFLTEAMDLGYYEFIETLIEFGARDFKSAKKIAKDHEPSLEILQREIDARYNDF